MCEKLKKPFAKKFSQHRFAAWIPGLCGACHQWPAYGLCQTCSGAIQKKVHRCRLCAIELASPSMEVCGYCLKHPFAFDSAFAACSYLSPWKEMVHHLKFSQGTDRSALMARLIYEQLQMSGELNVLPDLLLPIPASEARMHERGYNQSWELVKQLSNLIQAEARPDILLHSLGSPREHSRQMYRKRSERFSALRSVFFVNDQYFDFLRGRNIAVLDDVITTGATMHHAALVLKKSGAKRVRAWAFARTPEQRVYR